MDFNWKIMAKRIFVLGEEWVFLKIYVGPGTADLLISSHIGPFATAIVDEGLISRWFFVRYHDAQGFHVRIRFKLVDLRFLSDILIRVRDLFKPLVQQRLIHSLVYDTYTRELERYGASCYDLMEECFYEDSRCASSIITLINQYDDLSLRWKSAIALIDDILEARGLTMEEKKTLITSCRNAFREELRVTSPAQIRVFDRKFRENRKAITESVLKISFPEEMIQIIDRRRVSLHNILSRILAGGAPVNTASLVHMTCNRLFAGYSRLCELTLYEYLSRHYESLLAQEKYYKKS